MIWSIFSGTIVNLATVAIGSALGLFFSGKIPDRFQRIVITGLGLITITLGIDAAVITLNNTVARYGHGIPTYGARLGMIVVVSVILGAILGTFLKLHERIESLGRLIHQRLSPPQIRDATVGERHQPRHNSPTPPNTSLSSPHLIRTATVSGRTPNAPTDEQNAHRGQDPSQTLPSSKNDPARFAEGFLTASVIFCVGPLTLLGCLRNGASGDPSLLYIKSCLDGFCSMALASALGLGVAFSILTILFFQGGLALAAYALAGALPDLSIQLMNSVGGILLLATALSMLEIKKIPVANMLPALFIPPIAVYLAQLLSPHLLHPLD